MTQGNSQSLWQQAKLVFENYVDFPVEDSLEEIEKREDIEPLVKEKVIRLIKALDKSKTLLQQADSGQIFNSIKQLSDMTGQEIDGYVLNELIAVGGMSSIYLAQRIDSEVQKPVAIKVLSIQSDSADVVALFKRELKALSKLNHQNIVAFYHGGESTTGVYYLVMELLHQAINLEQFILNQQASVKQTVRLIHQVAMAMVNAHDHLIIHGDLKPDNILMDENHQLKVVDFGIAAFTYQNEQQQSRVFTPSVAPPEQVLGESITVKSDVFSLGATLLQLLTNQSPLPDFDMHNYSSSDIPSHTSRIMQEAGLDTDLCHIISMAMQTDPTKRYITMNGFAEDLDAWLTNRPVMAVQGGRLYHLKKFASRNKLLTAGTLLLMVLLIVAMVVVQNYAINAKSEAEKAQTALDFMTSVLSQADSAHIDQGNTTIKEAFKITLHQSDELSKYPPESQINILTQVMNIFSELALFTEAATTAEKIHQVYVLTEGPHSRNALHGLYEAAGHYHAATEFEKCLELGHEVIEQLDNNQLNYPVVRLNALNTIIKCHVERFENDEAYAYMKMAQELMESGKIKNYEALGRTYNSLAVITRRQNEFQLSEHYYLKSLLNIEKSLGKDNTAYATIMNGLGRMYMLQGRFEVAKPYLEESIQRVRSFDPDSHVLARNMGYYAKYLFYSGDQHAAIIMLDQATAIAEKRSHPFTMMTIQDLRHEYNSISGDFLTALDATQVSLQAAYQMYGRNHPRVSSYLHQMGLLLGVIGQDSLAEKSWQNNIDFYQKATEINKQKMAVTYAHMGLSAWQAGKPESARKYWQQADSLDANQSGVKTLAILLDETVVSELFADDSVAVNGNMTTEDTTWQIVQAKQLGHAELDACPAILSVLDNANALHKEIQLVNCANLNEEWRSAHEQFMHNVAQAKAAFSESHGQKTTQLLVEIK